MILGKGAKKSDIEWKIERSSRKKGRRKERKNKRRRYQHKRNMCSTANVKKSRFIQFALWKIDYILRHGESSAYAVSIWSARKETRRERENETKKPTKNVSFYCIICEVRHSVSNNLLLLWNIWGLQNVQTKQDECGAQQPAPRLDRLSCL